MKNDTTKLNTNPYKGTKDSYPEDMYIKNLLFDAWRKTAIKFGYEEYDTPLLEEAILYKTKSGDELGSEQLYSFTDKGGREVAIRPEMTPSLARMIAAKKNELSMPLRLFNIGKYYRYEKPQKGRSREFIQLNIDILGISGIEAELEIIQYVMSVMEELKAPKDTFELKVNNRYLLEYLFEKLLNLDKELVPATTKAIDNYLKVDKNEYQDYLDEVGLSKDQVEKLIAFLSWDISNLKEIENESRGAKELIELFEKIELLGLPNVVFSPYIVRGLQYYTGTVIEMFDVGGDDIPRAMFGGGRYDDLLEIFGQEKLPAFGLGWGDVTTINYLERYNLIPEYKTSTKVFITLIDENLQTDLNRIAMELREMGISVEMQLEEAKLAKQLKYASKRGYPWVIIMGENEKNKGIVILKDMYNEKQIEVKVEEILGQL